jgi:hypothetical protein
VYVCLTNTTLFLDMRAPLHCADSVHPFVHTRADIESKMNAAKYLTGDLGRSIRSDVSIARHAVKIRPTNSIGVKRLERLKSIIVMRVPRQQERSRPAGAGSAMAIASCSQNHWCRGCSLRLASVLHRWAPATTQPGARHQAAWCACPPTHLHRTRLMPVVATGTEKTQRRPSVAQALCLLSLEKSQRCVWPY